MTVLDAIVVSVYYGLLFALSIYALHRIHLIRLRRRSAPMPDSPDAPESWPGVTVQLPLYNEPGVAARLIDTVCRLDYPGPLTIQVLDDSTDETTGIVVAAVERLRGSGIRIEHVRRENRRGFKAGALASGMSRTAHEFLAVFDSDFVPEPDFLRKTIPWFADPGVGMVQARWSHINRDESILTRLQALYLDGHFGVESAARYLDDRFFNFNGTAGVWRRQAIESAGGWSSSTVTEDLDLSYRAQLVGWRFVFLPDHEVPAELPGTLSAFHGQQHRWAKGSIQTARRLLRKVLASNAALRVKVEAFFHLTNNAAYLITLLLALLLVPATLIRLEMGWSRVVFLDFALFFVSTTSLVAFYREGQRQTGRNAPSIGEYVSLVPFGIGLSVVNAGAVIEGLFARGGEFNRTPKKGLSARARLEHPPRFPLGELVLASFFAASILAMIRSGMYLPLPFLVLFLAGYGSVSIAAVRERARYHVQRREEGTHAATRCVLDLSENRETLPV